MQWFLVVFAAAAGVLNTVQSGSNTALNKELQLPVWSVVTVFSVGLVVSLMAALATGQRPPTLASASLVPWWGWIGGTFGAIYLLSMMLAADKLGAAVFMGITVTMAVITSLLMDHLGLMGFDVQRAGAGRIAGGVLMIVGLGLIAKF